MNWIEVVRYHRYPLKVWLVFAGFEFLLRDLLPVGSVDFGYNRNDVVGWNVLCGRWFHG